MVQWFTSLNRDLFSYLHFYIGGHERPSTSLLDQLKGHFEAIYCICLTKLIVFNVF